MNAVTRWKTIATIAVAFSAGNLFATACQDAGGGKASAETGDAPGGSEGGEGAGDDDETPPPAADSAGRAVVELFADIEMNACVEYYDGDVVGFGDCSCPPGFTAVGMSTRPWSSARAMAHIVCLED